MKKICLHLLTLLTATSAFAQSGSEIYLFDLSARKDKVSISKPVNITNHKGYDSQPFYHPDKPLVYYSSFNEDGRSDIRSYDYKKKQTKSITETKEREYSPTVTPDKGNLSCIIQRDNNAQDLGKYPIEGGEPSVILDHLIVGYHAWADNSHLALFVLGTPNTLHYLRLPTKKDTIIAQGIGRSLHKVPGETAISFVHKISENDWVIKKLETRTMVVSSVANTLPGREDICWLPDGRIITSDGTKLFFLKPGTGAVWKEVLVTTPTQALKGVTRLAVSANGKSLAVVVSEE